jgi:hypothetical protein
VDEILNANDVELAQALLNHIVGSDRRTVTVNLQRKMIILNGLCIVDSLHTITEN